MEIDLTPFFREAFGGHAHVYRLWTRQRAGSSWSLYDSETGGEKHTCLPSVSPNCCGSGVKKWFLKTLAKKRASVSELHKDLIKSADSRVPSHTFNQNLCADISF